MYVQNFHSDFLQLKIVHKLVSVGDVLVMLIFSCALSLVMVFLIVHQSLKYKDKKLLKNNKMKLPSLCCFSIVGEGNDVPYSGDISPIESDASVGAEVGGGEDGVSSCSCSKLVDIFS
jgi:hypothetical protein